MKNYINIALLTILIILSTIYFFNCRKLIMMQADEALDLYNSINQNLDELNTINKATSGNSNNNSGSPSGYQSGNGREPDIYGDNSSGGSIENSGTSEGITGNKPGGAVEAVNPNTEVLDGYFVTIIDNQIVVTLGDKKTILENTNISADELDDSDIIILKNGIYADDIMNIFSILESLSS